jgi:hypothetical protein
MSSWLALSRVWTADHQFRRTLQSLLMRRVDAGEEVTTCAKPKSDRIIDIVFSFE